MATGRVGDAAAEFVAAVQANVDSTELDDAAFRRFVRASLLIVKYAGVGRLIPVESVRSKELL